MEENTSTSSLEYGNVNISDEVIASIASISVSEIDGIHELSSNLTQNIGEIFGIKNQSKGFKIEIEESGVKVGVGIIIEFGVKIPEVCLNLQSSIKSAVESMTGLTVSAVDVHVNGIYIAPQNQTESEE